MKTPKLTATILAALLAPAWAGAQKLDLNFPNLAAQAKEKAEVDLDGQALTTAMQMAKGKSEKAEAALSSVQGVYVRHYTFASDGAYRDSDLDPLRKQVEGNSAWSRIINVKEPKESTQIYLLKSGGFLVVNAEAKEVNVVEILGSIDLAHMQELVNSTIKYDLKAAAEGAKQ
jgi:hypothetical protein